MPRPLRLNLAGYPQHVVQRGNNRQACFNSDSDYHLYLELLKIYCAKHQCRLHAYVLMTNHTHMLVTPDIPEGVSLLFRDLGRDYVRAFNKSNGRTGTLWDCRFKSSVVDSDEYLLACYRYIELNPVRARMVSHPADYQWSSYRANAAGTHDPLITPHETWMELGHTNEKRRQAYRRLFEVGLDVDELSTIRRGINKGLPTGTPDFTKTIESTLGFPIRTRRPAPVKSVPH